MEKADADAPHSLPLTCYAGAPPRWEPWQSGGVTHKKEQTRKTKPYVSALFVF